MWVAASVIGALIGALVLLYIWRYAAIVWGTRRQENSAMWRIAPLIRAADAGAEPPLDLILQLAKDPETRNDTHGMLVYLKREHWFPREYRTQEAVAESDMVYWLCHPNELGCTPSQIELVHRESVETGMIPAHVLHFVFRFRTPKPRWAASRGWMVGVARPYRERNNGEIWEHAPGTGSIYEPFDSQTVKEHVELVHEGMLKRAKAGRFPHS